jgi:phosphopantetheine adenylyltransferase
MVRGVAPTKGAKAPEELSLHVGGLFSRTHTHVTWLHRKLKMGDSVRIDIVEVAKVDRPKKKKSESPQSRMKREQDYVMKKAASWGWKIRK